MMIQQITIEEKQILVILSGSLYVEESVQLRDIMNTYIAKGYFQFVLDFGAVDYIDSSGLGTIVASHKRVLNNGGFLIVKNIQGLVKDLFELTHLNKVLDIR